MDTAQYALDIAAVVALIVVTVVVGGTAYLLVWGLLRAGSLRPSVALVIALSILTMVSIVGFIVTQTTGEQSTELATLAGMGLGGLAGAVTSVWSEDRQTVVNSTSLGSEPLNEVGEVQDSLQYDEWEDENPHSVVTPPEEDEVVEDTSGFPEDDGPREAED